MNYIETKKHLNRAFMSRQRIKSKRERLDRWKDQTTEITVQLSKDPVISTSEKQQMEKDIVAIVDLERTIEKDISDLAKLELEIQKEINLLDDDLQKTVLELRYLNFMKWDDICMELNYSSRQIFNIHKSAIMSFMKKQKK